MLCDTCFVCLYRSTRCGSCAMFFHSTCVASTSRVFICSVCFEEDPDSIPLFKNEDTIPVHKEKTGSTIDSFIDLYADSIEFETNVQNVKYSAVTNELVQYINFKCITDFTDPLPSVIVKWVKKSDQPIYGCYLPDKRWTVICISTEGIEDLSTLVAVLIHEFGHALKHHFSTGPMHGKDWLKHTKDIFSSVISRQDMIGKICGMRVNIHDKCNLIFTARLV